MAAMNGKWKLESSENAAQFYKTIGLPDEVLKTLAAHDDVKNDIVEEVKVTDTHVEVVYFMKGEEKNRIKHELNTWFEKTSSISKQTYKVYSTIDGGVIKTTQKQTQTGDEEGYTVEYNRSVAGDVMTVEMKNEAKDAGCTRKYKKIA